MRIGKVFFQSSGREDVFLSCDLRPDGIVDTMESIIGFPDLHGSDKAWINGQRPTRHKVHVSNDTGLLHCWYQIEQFSAPFSFTIYLECEVLEEIISEQEAKEIEDRFKPEEECNKSDRCQLFEELHNTS